MAQVKALSILPGPLPDFKAILEKWCKIVVSWSEVKGWEDVPWWYGERSSLGLFALAAWEAGAVPLEEYSTEKGKGRGRWTGRGDLLIQIGKVDYIIEAKQKWIAIGIRATKGEDKLDSAIRDALQGARHETMFAGRRTGLVFAVPYLPESEKDSVGQRLTDWVETIRGRSDCAIAWVFPEEARNGFIFDGYLYPGIAVLIRPLRR